MLERASGILLHISSLPSEFGIGDLGPGAYSFVDFLHQSKQRYWQILPINPTDAVTGHSPYSSPSAFAGNVLFISPELLVDHGLLEQKDITCRPAFPEGQVDFESVTVYKMRLLDRAYTQFMKKNLHATEEFQSFAEENHFWLEDYALYTAIKKMMNGKGWTAWPKPLKGRDADALKRFANGHKNEIGKIIFYQYVFFCQWKRLKAYCASKNVLLFGDLPIYMNMDSVDVWCYPENYKLDDRSHPVVVSGVPPDYFSKTGQRWGNPVYNWDVLQNNGFSWWVERFKFNFRMLDVVRIDHFRGLVQYWEIPSEERTAVKGYWADVPTDNFFETIQRECASSFSIIAEDLGYITDDVKDVMRQHDFPGMKILLFAFDDDMKGHPYLPHNFSDNCVVYTGTHDNNTVLGWFQDEASKIAIHHIQVYISKEVSAESIHWDLIRLAFESRAKLAIIPFQDLLGLGAEARMNTPATKSGNWTWRTLPGSFEEILSEKISCLTQEVGRCAFTLHANSG